MKERPIIFSADMVSAILRGHKTQTRRVIKPQPPAEIEEFLPADPEGFWGFNHDNRPTLCIHCPYGEIGDRLAVREAWRRTTDSKSFAVVQYRADGLIRKQISDNGGEGDPIRTQRHETPLDQLNKDGPPWKSPIHMPRWASRITLEITNLRVERLQDISEEDARAEGAQEIAVLPGDRGAFVPDFAMRWDGIHGAGSWAENPWVWVITFRKVNQ